MFYLFDYINIMKKKIKETIIVEGKYDKIRLSQLIEANIIQINGFMIFKNKEMISLLSKLADETGLIILTDSDKAGFSIRNYIKNCLAGKNVQHAFIPSIYGKEARKDKPGKEGLLGVEGMQEEVLVHAIEQAGYHVNTEKKEKITKYDLYKLGLYGGVESHKKRHALLKKLGLPYRLSANVLLEVMNALYTKEKFFELI